MNDTEPLPRYRHRRISTVKRVINTVLVVDAALIIALGIVWGLETGDPGSGSVPPLPLTSPIPKSAGIITLGPAAVLEATSATQTPRKPLPAVRTTPHPPTALPGPSSGPPAPFHFPVACRYGGSPFQHSPIRPQRFGVLMADRLPGEPNARDRMAVLWCNNGVPLEEIRRKLKYPSIGRLNQHIEHAVRWAAEQAALERTENP